jgi:hypothetical protein
MHAKHALYQLSYIPIVLLSDKISTFLDTLFFLFSLVTPTVVPVQNVLLSSVRCYVEYWVGSVLRMLSWWSSC